MHPVTTRHGWPWLALLVLVLLIAVPLAILNDPVRLRRMAESSLGRQLHLPVRIGRMARVGGWWWAPTLEGKDIIVGQAAWVAPRQPLAHLRRVEARLWLPAVLIGHSALGGVVIDGGTVLMRRNADGRSNWTDALPGQTRGTGETLQAKLTIRDLRLVYEDQRRDRRADVTIEANPGKDITLTGSGRVRGAPVAVRARIGAGGDFEGHVDGPTLRAAIKGRMDRPYSLAAFTGHLDASGHDLRDLDALAEAGLPATQPFTLRGDIRHEARNWIVTGLSGRLGRSPVDGYISVRKDGDRSIVRGSLHASALDFDDLSSDEGLAKAAAKRAQLGPRLVPDTPIALDHLQQTDGTLNVRADRLLWKQPAPFRSLAAHVALDHGVLALTDLRVGLEHGQIKGSATITQHGQVPTHLHLDLKLSGGRLEDFAGEGKILAPLGGRIDVDGTGRTIRAAFASANGKVALAATGGTINRRVAELIGRNVGRAMKADADARVPMRCLIAQFQGRGGLFETDPLIVDTAIARADGKGTLSFKDEGWTLSVGGGSKVPAAFRLTGPLAVQGTIKQPKLIPSAAATSAGGLLKMVGRAIAGAKDPAAPDADCDGLARRALE